MFQVEPDQTDRTGRKIRYSDLPMWMKLGILGGLAVSIPAIAGIIGVTIISIVELFT